MDRSARARGADLELSPLEVVARDGESAERLIRRFSRAVREDGVLREFSARRSFEKPSDRRRRKRSEARWKARTAHLRK